MISYYYYPIYIIGDDKMPRGMSMPEFWKRQKQEFAKMYEKAENKEAFLANYSIRFGMKTQKIREWANTAEAAMLYKETDPESLELLPCSNCGKEYSSKYSACPDCDTQKLKEIKKKQAEEKTIQLKQEEIQTSVDEAVKRKAEAVKTLQRLQDEMAPEGDERYFKVRKEIEEMNKKIGGDKNG